MAEPGSEPAKLAGPLQKALLAAVRGPVWHAGAWAAVCLARALPNDSSVRERLERASRLRAVESLGFPVPISMNAPEDELPAAARKALGR